MKGKFTLYRTEDDLRIGNLGKGADEPELFTIGSSGPWAARAIAHDVVEHKKGHIRNKSVTVEDELQALGAAYFVRGLCNMHEITNQLAYAHDRCLEPIPKNWVMQSDKHREDNWEWFIDDLKAEARDSIETEDIDETKLLHAMAHFWYGYALKSNQFKHDNITALAAFNFIKDSIEHVLRYEPIDEYQKLVVLYDTETLMFSYEHLTYYGD